MNLFEKGKWTTGLTICFICLTIPALGQTLRLLPGNPHYFEYQNKPMLIIGSGEHYGALIHSSFDLNKYFITLASSGLNHTRLFMGAYYEKPGAFGIKKNTLAPNPDQLILPWLSEQGKYDLSEWNPVYFSRLHRLMLSAADAGVIVEITLFSSYYGSGWNYHPFHPDQNKNSTPLNLDYRQAHTLDNGNLLHFQELYVRKLVRELNRYDNLYFEIQNEPWADLRDTLVIWNQNFRKEELKSPGNFWKNTIEVPHQSSYAWHRKVSEWITDEEKQLVKKHLISHNLANFKFPVSDNNPDISIYNFHYAFPEVVPMNYKLNKVIGFNETGFAGPEDFIYRRQAWRFVMSGGGLFSHLDYSFSTEHPDGTEKMDGSPGGGSPALRTQFAILKRFISGRDLISLKPGDAGIHHIEGAFSWTMQDKNSHLIYTEPVSHQPVLIRMDLPAGNYQAEWMDCETGKTVLSTPVQKLSGQYSFKSPGGMKDLIFLLTKL